MNSLRPALIAAAILSASAMLSMATHSASAAAIVYHANGSYECGADPGDVPGMPAFDLANTTVVIDANGALHVTCYGPLPAGPAVEQTFLGPVLCRGDETYADTTGRILVTKSGQAMIMCVFPASPAPSAVDVLTRLQP